MRGGWRDGPGPLEVLIIPHACDLRRRHHFANIPIKPQERILVALLG